MMMSCGCLLPYLTRFWIIEQLELNQKTLENERTKILEYLELIKTSYSEEGKNNLNNSIKDYLNNRNILNDLQVLIDNRNISVDANISPKPVKEWTKEDIQNWSKNVKVQISTGEGKSIIVAALAN
ncbi:unnamed protein product [Didymodactylos carnosus]|uniref:Uncharacterized protein n=1 Tax=Didymodactylos carnosus TaxID=1234261 RepID=A0A814JV34_9BILA|nr:unnamed protein product [Didymodactylos carnosus]CAF3813089.1 unnamed protein product [Didymodactylos carnosus]